MNDIDVAMELAAKTAQEMQELMLDRIGIKNMKNDSEFVLSFACMSLSSLISGFVDSIIVDDNLMVKKDLLRNILDMGDKLLMVKRISKQFNPTKEGH